MGRESLWGWFVVGVLANLAAAAVVTLALSSDASKWLLVVGVLLGVASTVVVLVTTIAIGVQLGMARHEYLMSRPEKR